MGNLNSGNSTQRSILRICCNLRYHTWEEAQDVIKVFNSLPTTIRNNLRRELSTTGEISWKIQGFNFLGTENSWGILLYYAPALLTNTQTPGQPRNLRGIELALIAMEKCFAASRKHIQERKGNGVFTADISNIAGYAKTNAEDLLRAQIVVNPIGEDCKLTFKLE